MTNTLDDSIKNRRILITCGTGGVGKTTLSAAIALRAAMQGKHAVVITIDPAKRLATSLGLEKLGDTPTDLTHLVQSACEKSGQTCKGTLSAVVPDSQETLQKFIKSLAPTEQVREKLLNNPIIEIFSRDFSGANEYLALQRVYALDRLNKFDFIVLDTPPSRNTLDFIEAPRLLARLFEEKLIRWLVLPANKIVAAGMKKAMGILEKLTGSGFVNHLFDFGGALFEIQTSFLNSLERINALLQSKDVGFLVVTAPTPETVPELEHFIQSVKDHQFHFDGIAINRTLSALDLDETARSNYDEAYQLLEALQKRELTALRDLKKFTQGTNLFCARLPELARDVHSVEDLYHVAMAFDRAHI